MQRCRKQACFLTLLLCLSSPVQADFDYADFTDMTGLTTVGNAGQFIDRVRLTIASISQVGALYTSEPQSVGQGFDTTFQYSISPTFGGADGMAFVIQNDAATALYSNGGQLGYHGMARSLVVEIDNYTNGNWADPAGQHLSVHGLIGQPNSADETLASLGMVSVSVTGLHTMRVRYDGTTFEVYLDDLDNPLISIDLNLEEYLESTEAWVGFTAATGGLTQVHELFSWSMTSTGASGTPFTRGDLNLDGSVNLPDAIYGLSSLFVPGSPFPGCADSADCNDDGSFNLPDAVFLLSALFVPGSPPIPEPSSCTDDPTDDPLECQTSACP
jgi:hypothetical protein